jgi:tetratricopeptide (TPR) repeat protein
MADQIVTEDVTGKTRRLRNRTDTRRNVIRRAVCWLSVCLMFITIASSVVYAQQFRYEACKLCNGTGKNLCKSCGGNKCQVCNFSGVQSLGDGWVLLNVPNQFSCPFCKGTGKQKVDTRFDGCFRTFYEVGVGSDRAYLCPPNHPIGRVIIVDSWESGKILKKYTMAEWDKKEADEYAETARKAEEERARKEEVARKAEEEREQAELVRAKQIKPQIELRIKEMERQQEQINQIRVTDGKQRLTEQDSRNFEIITTKYRKSLEDCAEKGSNLCTNCIDEMYAFGSFYFDQATYVTNQRFINEMKDYVHNGRGKEPVRPTVDYSILKNMLWTFSVTCPSSTKLPDVYFQLSQIYFSEERSDTARIILVQLIQRFPDSPRTTTARIKLGELALTKKDYNEAFNYLKEVKKKNVSLDTWEKVQLMLAEIKKSRK